MAEITKEEPTNMVPRRNKTPVVEQVQIEPEVPVTQTTRVPESIQKINKWGAPFVDDSIIKIRQDVKRFLFKMCRQFASDKGTRTRVQLNEKVFGLY